MKTQVRHDFQFLLNLPMIHLLLNNDEINWIHYTVIYHCNIDDFWAFIPVCNPGRLVFFVQNLNVKVLHKKAKIMSINPPCLTLINYD